MKNRYPSGTKLKLISMKDPYALKSGIYTVDFVDDADQIHLKESGLALIPRVDQFEYVCSKCGKSFSYPPATSRKDNSFICRICSAAEAISFLSEDTQSEILQIVSEHENG